jgi:N-acetylmuramoyl-L-alanine amidase
MPRTEPKIQVSPLPYESGLDLRPLDNIDLLVVHCTELPDLATARDYGERIHYEGSGTGNSGHFYVDRDGSVHRWVSIDHIAHHAGAYNQRSIGVELVNIGRWPDWFNSESQDMPEGYPRAQIAALVQLTGHLQDQLPGLRWITGHEDLDRSRVAASDAPEKLVYRKLDPGPKFPWPAVLLETGLTRLP